MLVTFDKFQLDTKNGLLMHKGQEVVLKPKQRALLLFFVDNPDVVLSKDQILDAVWQQRVVSEQVVFQTVSQLRAIVGERAIQTYARQGYKWTYAINHSAPQSSELAAIAEQKSNKPIAYAVCVLAFIVIAMGYTLLDSKPTHKTQIFFLPNKNKQTVPLITSSKLFALQALEVDEGSQIDPLNAPKLAFDELQLTKTSWLIGTRIFEVSNGTYLEFKLQNHQTQWHDYVFSDNKTELAKELHQRLAKLAKLGLFEAQKQPKLWLDTLEQKKNQTLSTLFFLAKHYQTSGHIDVALAYLDDIAEFEQRAETLPIRTEAALLKASIYKQNGQFTLAKSTLDHAEQDLKEQIWPLQFALIKKRAFLAYAMRDQEQVRAQLERGTQLAQHNIDAMGRFQLHILDSILSAKLDLSDRKYIQLNEAHQLITEENLHPANLAFVYFHYALFANETNIRSKYLTKILELPRSQTNFWVIDDAFERLFDLYIEHKHFAQADALLSQNINHTINSNLLRAKLLLAKQHTSQAISLLEEAYQQSQKAFDKNDSISAARALYLNLDEQSNKRQIYYDYLLRNGEQNWLLGNSSEKG
ncbi:hypothetical protein PA25_23620 [Pseudoalteromonas sp. A25]|uniref:winged helix-turn-helix domain-containing protein n=1 Tax=Pseudoalteromonas sp. A25 TaxID=116092 RepID=UPI00129FCEB8|nr:winged helix-turn-helix domain-containing protein [Pseudoalteromonas sp. A25]BBN82377.1 hypothetical protein PA25_23620 [Pseudoalteromonas sp. A25]